MINPRVFNTEEVRIALSQIAFDSNIDSDDEPAEVRKAMWDNAMFESTYEIPEIYKDIEQLLENSEDIDEVDSDENKSDKDLELEHQDLNDRDLVVQRPNKILVVQVEEQNNDQSITNLSI